MTKDIAVCGHHLSYGKSHAIWDHTVLSATWQWRLSQLYPSQSRYSI